MTEDHRVFEWALREVVKPELAKIGFRPTGGRRFRAIKGDGATWEVEFQLGVRALEGKFTVNLMVQEPNSKSPTIVRIGSVRQSWRSRFLARLFPSPRSIWRTLLGARDLWWPLTPFEHEARTSFSSVVAILLSDGVAWFQENTHAT